MKVLVAGDTHANMPWWHDWVIPEAQRRNAEQILQLGDFGYFPRLLGRAYLRDLNRRAQEASVSIVIVEGNHDDHETLAGLPALAGMGIIEPRIWRAGRGTRWVWGGLTFLALGGAHSIDQAQRTRGVDWWPEERITYAQARAAIEGGPADVLVCHDAPAGVPVLGNRDIDGSPETVENRHLLREVLDAVGASLVLHGHYHHHHRTRLGDAEVVGLDRDERPGSLAVLTVEAGSWSLLVLP